MSVQIVRPTAWRHQGLLRAKDRYILCTSGRRSYTAPVTTPFSSWLCSGESCHPSARHRSPPLLPCSPVGAAIRLTVRRAAHIAQLPPAKSDADSLDKRCDACCFNVTVVWNDMPKDVFFSSLYRVTCFMYVLITISCRMKKMIFIMSKKKC